MEKYSSIPTSDKSSADVLLEKEARASFDSSSMEDFGLKYRSRSWYRRNERMLIAGTLMFLANMSICIVYTHWLTSQYSHFQPTFPCEYLQGPTSQSKNAHTRQPLRETQ